MFRHDSFPVKGHIQVWGIRKGVKTLDFEFHNTIWPTLQTNLRNVMISRSVEYGVDAMAWGSFSGPTGSFIDSDYAGTTSIGTQGYLIQSSVGTNKAKFSGTFSFSTSKLLNYFELGRGYTAAGDGVTQLFSGRYAYDNSLVVATSSIQYDNGDQLIMDWTIQLGS